MKFFSSALLAAFGLVFMLTLMSLRIDPPNDETMALQDSLAQDRAMHVNKLRETFKADLRRPADSVFKNIKSMKGMPAGRLLAIMDIAYSRSLGVSCGHCHNTTRWDSDEKPQKQIARDMIDVVAKTTALVREIKGLKSENPVVNCTTCHRGALKPALDLATK